MLFNRNNLYEEKYDPNGNLYYTYNFHSYNFKKGPQTWDKYSPTHAVMRHPFTPSPQTYVVHLIAREKALKSIEYYSKLNTELEECFRSGLVYDLNFYVSYDKFISPYNKYNRVVSRIFGNYRYTGQKKHRSRRRLRMVASKSWKLCRLAQLYKKKHHIYYYGIRWIGFTRQRPIPFTRKQDYEQQKKFRINQFVYQIKVDERDENDPRKDDIFKVPPKKIIEPYYLKSTSLITPLPELKYAELHKTVVDAAMERNTIFLFSHRSNLLSLTSILSVLLLFLCI